MTWSRSTPDENGTLPERGGGCKKLRAGLGWRLRVGEYRVIYDVDDSAKTVTVWHIGPRSGAY